MSWPLDAVALAVWTATGADGYGAAEHGVLRGDGRVVRRLGLALDQRDARPAWVRASAIDALFVHRPWSLPLDAIGDLPVLFAHRPFDDRFTTGPNTALTTALGMRDVRPFGERDGRPLAMIGEVVQADAANATATVRETFGGLEDERPGDGRPVRRVVVASAMTDALVREAAGLGADLYVTGQLRAPGLAPAHALGLHVLAIGHRRSERWGLGALAHALQAALPGLECEVAGEPPDERCAAADAGATGG
jgi:putative NIF3 family GTP cyclohydrolase 1 type 2